MAIKRTIHEYCQKCGELDARETEAWIIWNLHDCPKAPPGRPMTPPKWTQKADITFTPKPPRTLDQITTAARQGLPASVDELRLAVCAYDVLMANLKVVENAVQLAEYFKAADTVPEIYLGPNNDPREPGVKEWHEAFINIEEKQDENRN